MHKLFTKRFVEIKTENQQAVLSIHRTRDLTVRLGLTPLNKSSGGKERLDKITKSYIRKLLVVGMTPRAVMAKRSPERVDLWTANILAEKPFRLAITAMANKAARIIWAMLTKQHSNRANCQEMQDVEMMMRN